MKSIKNLSFFFGLPCLNYIKFFLFKLDGQIFIQKILYSIKFIYIITHAKKEDNKI